MVNLFLSRTSSSFCFLAPILCDNGAFILLLLQLDAGTKLDRFCRPFIFFFFPIRAWKVGEYSDGLRKTGSPSWSAVQPWN
jgi:hypothetical protein